VNPERVKVMQDVIVNYNDQNPLNDYKVHAQEQNQAAHAAVNLKLDVPENMAPTLTVQAESVAAPHILTAKRILIAIPTAKHVEVLTFKSLWDLHKPTNTQLDFQYFYGYNVQQVRNTQARWVLNNAYDHVLHVDSDMILPPHTLECLLDMQTDTRGITSGIYVQRKDHEQVCEAYVTDSQTGGHAHLPVEDLMPHRILDVAAVGFGGCLVRRDVYKQVAEPWFEYHMHTSGAPRVSEDVDFCMKAQQAGFTVGVHTGLRYGHIHQTILHAPG
jgi:hypothetical protein